MVENYSTGYTNSLVKKDVRCGSISITDTSKKYFRILMPLERQIHITIPIVFHVWLIKLYDMIDNR